MSLSELAAAHGVATSYADWSGREIGVGRPAVVAALAALDVAAGTDEQVEAALHEVRDRPWRRLLPTCVVARSSPVTVTVHAPAGQRLVLEVDTEDGEVLPVTAEPVTVEVRGDRVRQTVELPDLPLGWHRLRARAGQESDETTLAVTPGRVEVPHRRSWGWMVQLYSLRSEGSWGVGDYADLRTVAEASAADGAGALLVNPLHAETPVLPINPSPYSPSSRRFRSHLWLRIEDVPELAAAPAEVRARVAALRPPTDPDRVQREPAHVAKLAALELLWPLHRQRELAAHRAERGAALEDFALFCAMAQVHGAPWQQWPEELRRPDGKGIPAARVELADRTAFWCWVQLLVDEQLAGVGRDMAVGVIHDLAVGVDAGGADAWALQDVLALGTTVGAPPDSFNQQGQDWGLPPWRPDRLAEAGYAPYRSLVQGVLRHAGGLRIDHVMGLFRLWWVPQGMGAADGTYVSYDADALLGVLALEASRAGAVVVGEDLGTVQEHVRGALAGAGVMGSDVLWFQTDAAGAPIEPAGWRPDALATVTTHDLPTAAGYLVDEHVRVRHELGQLGHSLEHEQARVATERARLIGMLERTGLLAQCGGDAALAMHAALVAAPCRVVLAAYGDAVGDLRQPNLPGTVDAYPNWRLPVADGDGHPISLEQLLVHPGVRRLTALLRQVGGADSLP